MTSGEQVIFLIAYKDVKLGPLLVGQKYLKKPGMPHFSQSVLKNITIDSLLTRSNPLILYIKDENQNPYLIQVKKFSDTSPSSSSLFTSSIAIIFIIPKEIQQKFPIPIRKEFVRRIFNECKCTESAEYFVFNFNLRLGEYIDTVKTQNPTNVLNSTA